MADKPAQTPRGYYVLYILTILNLSAIVCLSILFFKDERFEDCIKLPDVKTTVQQLLNDGQQAVKHLGKRGVSDSQMQQLRAELIDSCRQEVVDVLKEAAGYMMPTTEDRKRQTSSAGNELANIFGEIAKTEVDLLAQYCNNGSTICLSGDKGAAGEKGEPGLQGLQGLPGNKGEMGLSGLNGTDGLDGQKGERGNVGLKGERGIAGIKGDAGTKGDPGIQGLQGLKGDQGMNGTDGIAGVQGPKGDSGSIGPKGDTGAAGTNGTDGLQGIKGDSGPSGPKGDAGAPGANGADGVQGSKGDAGIAGAKGEPGVRGADGASGTPGLKGDKGDAGAKGADGTTGQNGSNGLPGIKGEKGDPGTRAAPVLLPPQPTPTPCCNSLAVPQFPQQLQEIRVTEGTDVTFDCDANGFPSPTFTWNPPPTGGGARTFMTPSSMMISNTHVNDSKLYTCSAKNALGTSEKQFLLKVYEHLSFVKTPSNDTVMMGNNVVFECDVTGPLSPNVTWYKVMKDGSRFKLTSGVSGTTLTVSGVTSMDQGQYVCVGSNGVESIESTAYLNTFGPPHIRPPGTVTTIKGQETRLRCIADAHPPATITWTYPPGVTNAYKDTDGSLVILKTEPKDAVSFFCTATNKYGSDHATVSVVVQVPPEVTVTPDHVAVDSGVTNVAIQCQTTGDQPLVVTWHKDGSQITSGGHVFILPGNVLLVNKATAADYGIYTCTATNSIGSASQSAYVYDGSAVKAPVSCAYTFANCQDNACAADCPAGCATDPSPVYGFMSYHQSSSACRAGIQSGAINATGGTMVWYSIKGTAPFSSGSQNGVDSLSHAGGQGAIPVV